MSVDLTKEEKAKQKARQDLAEAYEAMSKRTYKRRLSKGLTSPLSWYCKQQAKALKGQKEQDRRKASDAHNIRIDSSLSDSGTSDA